MVGLILGFALGYMTSSPSDETREFADDTKEFGADMQVNPGALVGNTSSGQTAPSDYVLSVNDQVGANSVMVSNVNLPEKSWIAITDDNDGNLSYILGAQRFPAGVHSNVQVELLRPTLANTKYHAVVYTDDGDDMFDFRSDVLVTNPDGSLLVADFMATN